MAEIITIPDLENGKVDIDTLADIVNLQEPTTETRLSGPVNTWFGVQAQLSSASGLVYKTKADLDLWPGSVIGQSARVTDDGDNNGLYRWGGTIWQKTTDPFDINTLTANRGDALPLKPMTRGGITSASSAFWVNSLLQIRVSGPISEMAGKYYRVGYFQNGATIGTGSPDNGIVLEELDAATYESTGTAVEIHGFNDSPAAYVRADGGIQQFSVVPALRPNMVFDFSIDVDGLPPDGTALNASYNNASPAWSWIIDPSSYQPKPTKELNSILVNEGSDYPFKPAVRSGVLSPENTAFTSAILDFKVLGADPGYVYRCAYYVNGNPALPAAPEGWLFEKYDAATYSTSATTIVIHALAAGDPAVDRSIVGPQVLTIPCRDDPGTTIQITLDAAKLPPRGTSIASSSAGQTLGRSWIIDQHCYFQKSSAPVAISSKQHLYYSRTGNTVTTAWKDTNQLMRVDFGPNGFNGLPNIMGVYRSTSTNIETASWIPINVSTTDWISPTVFRATTDFTAGVPVRFTGGNHGSNGDATGQQTALNLIYMLFADGEPIIDGDSGYCSCVSAVNSDVLLAYNTFVQGRYCLEQTYRVDIFPGSAQISMKKTNIDTANIVMERDYSVQMVSTGFNTNALIIDGQYTTKQAYSASIASGTVDTYPDSWAVLLDSANGRQAAWIDRGYGTLSNGTIFDVTSGNPTKSNIFFSSSKTYVMSFWKNDGADAAILAPGDSYVWRGGLAWGGNATISPEYMAAIQLRKEGQLMSLTALNPQRYSFI